MEKKKNKKLLLEGGLPGIIESPSLERRRKALKIFLKKIGPKEKSQNQKLTARTKRKLIDLTHGG